MNKVANNDLKDAVEALESLKALLPKLSLVDQVDAGARIRAIKNRAKELDDLLTEDLKGMLNNEDGVLKGGAFDANLAYHDVTRLDQQLLQELYPAAYKKCLRAKPQGTLTYKPR